jgi:hypothetical protein
MLKYNDDDNGDVYYSSHRKLIYCKNAYSTYICFFYNIVRYLWSHDVSDKKWKLNRSLFMPSPEKKVSGLVKRERILKKKNW